MAKNILTDFDLEGYYSLLQKAHSNGVSIVHTHAPEFREAGSGFTFAWKRAAKHIKCRMVEVAVSFCSPKDTFCKKIGAYNALANFDYGHTILLPVGNEDSAQIIHNLRQTFMYCNDS